MNHISKQSVSAVILAGGQGSRMEGADKGLIQYNGQPLAGLISDGLKPQVEEVIINANRNVSEYEGFGFKVVSDSMADFQGPLAGVLAGLEAATTDYVMTVPCDGPHVPNDLVERMMATINAGAEIAVAHDGKRFQPVYAMLPRSLVPSLKEFLASGQRKIIIWYREHGVQASDFSDIPNTFINLNTKNELDAQQAKAGAAE